MGPLKQANCQVKIGVALAVFVLYLLAAQAHAQQTGVQSIVDQNFPQALLDADAEVVNNIGELDRNSSFAVYDTLPNGAPRTIMACYSDNVGVAIRVIQAQPGGGYSVIFEPSNLLLIGTDCGLTLVDVDGDGVNELELSLASMKGNSSDWIFKWDGSQLTNIGAVGVDKFGVTGTFLLNSMFVDLDHDGTLQILSVGQTFAPQQGALPTATGTIYHLQNGKYVQERNILFFRTFYRGKGAPELGLDTGGFSLLKSSTGPYLLRVVNGDKDGSHRASSGHIVVNGVEVIGPNRFNQQVEFVSAPVNLQTHNTIQVTLEGKPESKILVTVEDQGTAHKTQQQSSNP